MNDFYEKFIRLKKINLPKFFFFVFLVFIFIIIIISTIGLVLDITVNINTQIVYKFGSDKQSDSRFVHNIITTQVIKFITIVLFSLVFCIFIWLGIHRVAYGYAFTIIFTLIFSLFFSFPFVLSLKPLFYDIVQMVASLIIIIFLLFFGLRQKYHRASLRAKLLLKKRSI